MKDIRELAALLQLSENNKLPQLVQLASLAQRQAEFGQDLSLRQQALAQQALENSRLNRYRDQRLTNQQNQFDAGLQSTEARAADELAARQKYQRESLGIRRQQLEAMLPLYAAQVENYESLAGERERSRQLLDSFMRMNQGGGQSDQQVPIPPGLTPEYFMNQLQQQ